MNEELYHHGVLGMKWGIRKYQNKDGSLTTAGKQHYKYTSFSTKHYTRKANKLKTRLATETDKVKRADYKEAIRKAEAKAKISAELDSREEAYARRVSAGKNIATRLVTGGSVGSKPYQQYLAMMNATTERGVTAPKIGAAIATSALGGRLGSTIAKQIYIETRYRANS